MITATNNVPLWLDIKTEYIDENFEKLIEYLKGGNKNDVFYQTTVELLEKRIGEYLKTLKNRPACFGETNDYDVEKLGFETRLMGAYLLVDKNADVIKLKRRYMSFLYSLSLLVPTEICGDLLGLMVDNVICEEEPDLVFGWDDICDFRPSVIAHKIIKSVQFKESRTADLAYENKGCVTLWKDVLGIAALNLDDIKSKRSQLVDTIEVLDGKIKMLSVKGLKLKQSEENNIEAIEKHTLAFIQEQAKVKPVAAKPKKVYSDDDKLYVKIKSCVWDKINVVSIDPEYESIEGMLCFNDSNILYYYNEDFYKYLKQGQIIHVKLESYTRKTFSLKEQFIEYIIEDVVIGDGHINKVEPAKVAKIYKDKRGEMQMDWLTKSGFPVHTSYDDRFEQNDFGMVEILNTAKGLYYGYVYGRVDDADPEPFDFQLSKKNVIMGFDFEDYDNEEVEAKETMMNTAVIRDLLNMMVRYQKMVVNPIERFKLLCVSLVVATLIEAEEHQRYIRFIMAYLKQLLYFVKGDYAKIKDLEPDESILDLCVVKQRCDVIKILKKYDNEDPECFLDSVIAESEDETLIKISKLIQSCNIIGGVIPASTKNIIKREIVKSLSLETDDETDLEKENGIYLGIENLHQEFKTSFVYPPDNDMQPNVAIQEKNIFKCLCGFLNSEGGGTLYIGVTDLGYVCGVGNDMAYLKHTEMDTYTRYIQDAASRYYPVDVLNNFVIKPMYDNMVVAIKVDPYEDGVVEFEGKAYIRINNETMVMNPKLKKIIIAKKQKNK